MSCNSRNTTVRRRVWTKRGASQTETRNFIPFVQGSVRKLGKLKVSYNLRERLDGAVRVRCNIRYSTDGVSWGSEHFIGGWGSTDGWNHFSFDSFQTDQRLFRVGIEAENTGTFGELVCGDVEMKVTLLGR